MFVGSLASTTNNCGVSPGLPRLENANRSPPSEIRSSPPPRSPRDHFRFKQFRVGRIAYIDGGQHKIACRPDVAGIAERAEPTTLRGDHKRQVAVDRDAMHLHRAGDVQFADDFAAAGSVAVDLVRIADVHGEDLADAVLRVGAGGSRGGDQQRLRVGEREAGNEVVAAIAGGGIIGGAVDVEELVLQIEDARVECGSWVNCHVEDGSILRGDGAVGFDDFARTREEMVADHHAAAGKLIRWKEPFDGLGKRGLCEVDVLKGAALGRRDIRIGARADGDQPAAVQDAGRISAVSPVFQVHRIGGVGNIDHIETVVAHDVEDAVGRVQGRSLEHVVRAGVALKITDRHLGDDGQRIAHVHVAIDLQRIGDRVRAGRQLLRPDGQ